MTHLTNICQRISRISRSRAATFAVALFVGISPVQYSSAAVSQVPLYLGGGGVPGNLVLTPSVEFPTIQSLANLGSYSTDRRFEGYFDPDKCYRYDYDGENDPDNHFYPSSRQPIGRVLEAVNGVAIFLTGLLLRPLILSEKY